jgi:uncharacterized membrane protein
MRRGGILVSFLIAMLLMLGAGREASADFRICNRSLVKVAISFGYYETGAGLTSKGWWNLPVGECATVFNGDVSSHIFYVYATGEGGRVWKGDDAQDGGVFCVSPQKYLARNRDYKSAANTINCEAAGMQEKKFRRFEVGAVSDYTQNLTSRLDGPPVQPVNPRPVTNTPAPAPSPAPPVIPGQGGSAGSACQRFPNLC